MLKHKRSKCSIACDKISKTAAKENGMREYLTIGEVSRLLNISAHNIRYYEKEGLITPKHETDNGYRMYDYEDVYRLYGILMLRDSDVPIKEIKKLIVNYNVNDYLAAVRSSYDKVELEIERLKTRRKQLKNTINIVEQFLKNQFFFTIKSLNNRLFKVVMRSDYEMSYSIKTLYDAFIQNHIDMSGLYDADTYYYLTEQDISYCVLDNEDEYDLQGVEFTQGKYLSYNFYVESDIEIDRRIEEMFEYMHKHEMRYDGDMLLIIGISTAMISETGYAGELQIKLK